MKVLCGDIETDGLLPELTKFHCANFRCPDTNQVWEFTDIVELEKFLADHSDHMLAIHNGICYDKPALEKLGITVNNEIIDTLALSYYLHLRRPRHGLASWGEEAGQPKPPVEDWSYQPIEVYLDRCKCDVIIQTYIWKKFKARLLDIYGDEEGSLKLIRYLNFKMEQQRIQENNSIRLDVPAAKELLATLEQIRDVKKAELESIMPKVPVYKTRSKPKVLYKLNGDRSANHIKWLDFLTEQGIAQGNHSKTFEVTYIDGYLPPNSASHQQVKDWLYSLGWKPETFKLVKDDKDPEQLKKEQDEAKRAVKGSKRRPKWVKPYTERYIPQILTEDKDICPSISLLAASVPEVAALEGLGVVQHRIGVVAGFLEAASKQGGYLIAGMSGLCNTLRLKHRQLVNIPSARKQYGKEIRSLLLADSGGLLLGSDLSSLEDRLKHSFQWEYDPEYVKTQMADDYDGHTLTAMAAELITEADVNWYKWAKALGDDLPSEYKTRFANLGQSRHIGKSTNYSCQYLAGAETVARSAGVPLELGKKLVEAYWKLNWSIKVIAEATVVKKDGSGQMWQLNPLNGFWYHLKTLKDRFSTLIQGSASYIFDMWVFHINDICTERFGKDLPLAGSFHDELILKLKDSEKSKIVMKGVVIEALDMVNSSLEGKLNRMMACDVSFGKNYYEVH